MQPNASPILLARDVFSGLVLPDARLARRHRTRARQVFGRTAASVALLDGAAGLSATPRTRVITLREYL